MSLPAYIDTSVFGGYFDQGFDEASRRLFEAVAAKQILPLISDVLLAEIGRAPQPVRDLLAQVICGGIERLAVTEEAIEWQLYEFWRRNMETTKLMLDAIEMKRRIQAEIAAETRHMTSRERLAYFKQQVENGPFHELLVTADEHAVPGVIEPERRS